MEQCKSSVRGKVEHLFFYVKQMFGTNKISIKVLGRTKIGWRSCLVLPAYFVPNLLWCESYRISVPDYHQSDTGSAIQQGFSLLADRLEPVLTSLDWCSPPMAMQNPVWPIFAG